MAGRHRRTTAGCGNVSAIGAASDSGSQSSTVVPSPGWLVMRIAPPDCAATPCTIDRPSPVPLPAPLVVKNGSAARFNVAASMPAPVSDTVRQT